jgi:hypothetical protein
VTIHYLESERALCADIRILAEHRQDLFLFDPNLVGGRFSHIQSWRDGPTLIAEVGSPGIREDGLLKMVLIPAGERYDTRIWLTKGVNISDVQSIRVSLVFLPDPRGSFKRMFGNLKDTGLTWSAEVGSPSWCQYMAHLVYDEVSIPIRTNIHVCDE